MDFWRGAVLAPRREAGLRPATSEGRARWLVRLREAGRVRRREAWEAAYREEPRTGYRSNAQRPRRTVARAHVQKKKLTAK
jgi:hypothetical protein